MEHYTNMCLWAFISSQLWRCVYLDPELKRVIDEKRKQHHGAYEVQVFEISSNFILPAAYEITSVAFMFLLLFLQIKEFECS